MKRAGADIAKDKRMKPDCTHLHVTKVEVAQSGGYNVLDLVSDVEPTMGPNLKEVPGREAYPGLGMSGTEEDRLCIVKTFAAGVNYADVCIRWGLYSSANKYNGYPITPGFEFSGIVLQVGSSVSRFKEGDVVFGVTMFGGYSTHVKVPEHQLFHLPHFLNRVDAAAFPGVALTAWMAVDLANPRKGSIVLVHSAAGGVGSMLVQICKIKGCKVVAVVGASHKVELCKELGADSVIDKSRENLWHAAKNASPAGYHVIFDANGVETLQYSYEHLAPLGKLVVYGFHSMLPKVGGKLSIMQWLKMGWDWIWTPRFNPLTMVPDNKSVMAFNLSYLFDQVDHCIEAMHELLSWVEEGRLKVPRVTQFQLADVADAHRAIESGQTTGKLVLLTSKDDS